ncbi:hypothetical protein CTI12_AA231920 [Artemisia annua]|uniref:Uncharacterized protein n=1 Tax=Artemisia annua TaxID=35608 RepID=A0A2U1NTD9_ARTAN|nr:hypothetical protein CTI12_AA231920 [Artemisia annua]
MGNFTSCFASGLKTARLVDLQGNVQHVKVPITAAEVMLLEEPGHLVSQVVESDLVSCFRLWALRADEELASGKLYLLIPVGRLNSFVSETELEMLRSCCKKVKKVKRRNNSKVLPQGQTDCEGPSDNLGPSLEEFTSQRMGSSPMWKPVLEPIYE